MLFTMKVLFYRYGSICEPDVMDCFRQAGLTVVEETTQLSNKNVAESQTASAVSSLLSQGGFLFVFTINFFPVVSDVCRIHGVPYVCWTVDSPVMELFSKALENDCNRIFLFDRAQYNEFRSANPAHVFHLPLATNVTRWDRVIADASVTEKKGFTADVSFVGSLYREHNALRKLTFLSDYTRGFIQGIVEAQLNVFGYNFIEDALDDTVLREIREKVPEVESHLFDGEEKALRYYVAHSLAGVELAQIERERMLNLLAEKLSGHVDIRLYTNSDASVLRGVHVHGSVKSLTEMPLVFHESKINLNFTTRPIKTGLPLRVFDICGAGGFLLTNYQEELAEHYEPGVEAEFFSSPEELADKAAFYLSHDAARESIARKGYERTKREHTYPHRINTMIRQIMETI